MYLADGYFADSFADADDIVTFGDVNGVFAIRLFQLDSLTRMPTTLYISSLLPMGAFFTTTLLS